MADGYAAVFQQLTWSAVARHSPPFNNRQRDELATGVRGDRDADLELPVNSGLDGGLRQAAALQDVGPTRC